MSAKQDFQQKLNDAITDNSPICVGVDPHPERVPTFLKKEWIKLGSRRFLDRYCSTIVEASSGCCAVKFQSAYFEVYGEEGFASLRSGITEANSKNLFTILDAKRGDISATMAAYGQMAFDTFKADSLTVTPYMGFDVVKPLVPWLQAGKGVFIVWITSNPEGRFLQDLSIETSSGPSKSVSSHLFDYFKDHARREAVQNSLGFVLGATKLGGLPDDLYKKLSDTPLLMPGVGPQGGKITARLKTLLSQKHGVLPMSRGLTTASDEEDKNIVSWADFGSLVATKINHAIKTLAT